MSSVGLLKERAKLKRLVREYEGLLFLLNLTTVESNRQVAEAKANFERNGFAKLKTAQIRQWIQRLEDEIRCMRTDYGVKADVALIERYLRKAEETPDYDFNIPRFIFDEFVDGSKFIPEYDRIPEHAFISLHPGNLRKQPGEFEIHITEAHLYEDMCALFNAANQMNQKVSAFYLGKGESKVKRKINAAFHRATTTAAFAFVEAYLNGIAYDHLVVERDNLSDRDKTLLREWDHIKNRRHFLSLRDKAVQYPKIILKTRHPPIQENNCPELAFLVNRVKVVRDAIAHPSPGPDLDSMEPMRGEQEFMSPNLAEVEHVVDKAIAFVKRVEQTIRGNDRRLFWLYERGKDGLFPEDVFL